MPQTHIPRVHEVRHDLRHPRRSAPATEVVVAETVRIRHAVSVDPVRGPDAARQETDGCVVGAAHVVLAAGFGEGVAGAETREVGEQVVVDGFGVGEDLAEVRWWDAEEHGAEPCWGEREGEECWD